MQRIPGTGPTEGRPTLDPASAAELADNVRSIERAPRAILPHGPARSHLLALAHRGLDVYCYRAAGMDGPWNVWLCDRRIALADYVAHYQGTQGAPDREGAPRA